jgi:hypothetical protein
VTSGAKALEIGSAVIVHSNEKAEVFHPYKPTTDEQTRSSVFRDRFGFDFAPDIGERTHAGVQRRLRDGERGRITAIVTSKNKLMYWVRLGNGPDEVRLYPRQISQIIT